jgi:hypothetical protein
LSAFKEVRNERGDAEAQPTRATAEAISPERVANLAAALTGGTKAEKKSSKSYKAACPACGATHAFSSDDLPQWETDDGDSSTDNDDDEDADLRENDGDTDDSEDFEDRKAKAVKAAVQRVRNEATTKQANPLADALRDIRGNRR